MIIDNM